MRRESREKLGRDDRNCDGGGVAGGSAAGGDLGVESGEEGGVPLDATAGNFEGEGGGGFGQWLLGDDQDEGGGVLDGEAESMPPSYRNPIEVTEGEVLDVEDEDAEAAGLKEEIGRFQ